ncbi:glycosyl hydrolase family 28-related protein [Actinomadura rudentiformis]|uniref:Rhamnogalacturonase A/B/Epimerase-like pectate lyase domain-containing protein n=1 Tax=Actinomadura rudentiformis TaxID=359158 RepID=A0A6H9YXI4_9ACTN|nr:glycosyl hydrolase family 28-related protein [Actinomadura rudentiformis]KAB2344892.1 hypothetical protein F8566_30345 [Actinomadura rudentiformis]
MGRHWFGAGLADWTFTTGDGSVLLLAPSAVVTFWNAPTGGVRYTDLLSAGEAPMDAVVSGDGVNTPAGMLPRFQGPPEVLGMWADAGAGTRLWITATDLGDTIASLTAATTWSSGLREFLLTGQPGQVLTKDSDAGALYGARWASLPSTANSPWVNAVLSPYDADPTGRVDARPAIQAAIDNVANQGGGVVYLPRGDYLIGYTSNVGGTGCAGGLQMRTGVTLRGESRYATRLIAAGTWATETAVIGVGSRTVSRSDVHDWAVTDLWIKASPGNTHTEPTANPADGILLNTTGLTIEPDAANRLERLLIWDLHEGLVIIGDDDQAMIVSDVRLRRFWRRGVQVGRDDGSGGAPDNKFHLLDVSGANHSGQGYAGIEVYAAQCNFYGCGSWYNRRSSAYVESADYKDGAGFYNRGVRNVYSHCQAQDNGGHGFLLRLGKSQLTGCYAETSSRYDTLSGEARPYECSGFYIGPQASELTIDGAVAFNRTIGESGNQKHGFVIDAAARNIRVSGIAYDNRSSAQATDPADGVHWLGGTPHASHQVRVLSAYQSNRLTITTDTNSSSGTGVVNRRQDAAEVTITGNSLADVPKLSASVPGGSRWYRFEAFVLYRADADANARIGIKITRDTASGTVEANWQANFVTPAGAAGCAYCLSTPAVTRYVVADGDGAVTGVGWANQRSLTIVGELYVAPGVGTATLTLQACEDTGTGEGVRVKENSFLTVTPRTVT